MSQVQLNNESADKNARSESILEVTGLNVTFEKSTGTLRRRRILIKAADNISFDIKRSEFFSIVGESGSGKTTVARCILKLAKPDSGSIKFEGDEVTTLKGKSLGNFRKNVQMVFQDPFESLNPRMDVFETIAGPIRYLTGERDQRQLKEIISNLLDEVGLIPNIIMHRLPHQLSGGQRQRVNIARALGPNPRLLIADEPITMLDAAQRLNLLSLLMDLREKRNLSILMITHDLASAKLTSDRLMVMYLGKIFEVGKANDVLTRPHHPYVELILSSTPKHQRSTDISLVPSQSANHSTPSAALSSLIPSIEESEKISHGCVFRPRCKYATALCSEKEPKLEEKSKGHEAACHNPLNSAVQ